MGRLIKVHVHAGAKKERVVCLRPDAYEMEVKEPALRNAANVRVRELLAHEIGVRPQALRLTVGHHRSRKTFCVIE